jgi:AcrR family transcriptional regulator
MNKRSGIESKRRILAAAIRVFSEYGYKGASMRMIAKRAEISVGGLYLYYKNKEDLYLTLMKDRLDDLTGQTREAVKDIEDPAEAMRTFLTLRLNYAREHREIILALGRDPGFSFGIEIKKKFFRQQRNVIEEILKKGISSSTFRECNTQEVAKVIFSIVRGFIVSLVIEPDALFSSEECCDLILNGLLKKRR